MRRYYEFALIVVIVSILATLLLYELNDIQGNMEEAAVQAEVASIRAQLLERIAHREAFGGRLPDSDNPLDWIANSPPNYIGALDRPPASNGVWYFDTRSKELVYGFRDGHLAQFRLSRSASQEHERGVMAGVGFVKVK